MPARRTHSKSRRGCIQCKGRHVKCDEVSPVCGNCAKRATNCSYVTNDSPAESGAHDPTNPNHMSNAGYPVLPRVQELSLIHHYATSTWRTLAVDPKDHRMWEVEIPKLAFQHSFVLDVLLAITALHKGIDIVYAVQYQNRGLARFKDVLSRGITRELSHPALAFALVTSLMAFAMPHSESEDATEQVLLLRDHFRGLTAIALSSQDVMPDGAMRSIFQQPTVTWQLHPDHLRTIEENLHSLYALSAEEPEVAVHHTAIRELITNFNENFQRIIAIPVHLEAQFVQLIRQRSPMALMIFACYGVMLNLFKEWWARDVGKRLVQSVTTPMDMFMSNPQRLSVVTWARQEVGLDAKPDGDLRPNAVVDVMSVVDTPSPAPLQEPAMKAENWLRTDYLLNILNKQSITAESSPSGNTDLLEN